MMKAPSAGLAIAALTLFLPASPAFAQDAHTVVAPEQVTWGPAPDVLPPGAEAALLFGDPGKEGLFALRLKMPAGYVIPPHTHPAIEAVTVISGTFKLGMGKRPTLPLQRHYRREASSPCRLVRRILRLPTRRRSCKSQRTGRGALLTSTPATIRGRPSRQSQTRRE
jgi:hypothetical protein